MGSMIHRSNRLLKHAEVQSYKANTERHLILLIKVTYKGGMRLMEALMRARETRITIVSQGNSLNIRP